MIASEVKERDPVQELYGMTEEERRDDVSFSQRSACSDKRILYARSRAEALNRSASGQALRDDKVSGYLDLWEVS